MAEMVNRYVVLLFRAVNYALQESPIYVAWREGFLKALTRQQASSVDGPTTPAKWPNVMYWIMSDHDDSATTLSFRIRTNSKR